MMRVSHLLFYIFSLAVGTGHLTVILVYFFGLIRDGKVNYISDILSSDKLYMNLMTFFVLLQLTVCFGFVRVHTPASNATSVLVELLFLALSWIGWCILIIQYEVNGEVSRLHYMGVGLFVCGGVVYFAFLIWELYNRDACVSWVLILLYISSAVLGFLFIVSYFAGSGTAWIFEHTAFIAFSLAHMVLFYQDMEGEAGGSVAGLFDGVRIELNFGCCVSRNTSV
jgi:hypothetical protein